MKTLIIIAASILSSYTMLAQATPSNLNAPANAQPVPQSLKTEKTSPTPKPLISVALPEKPSVYPGAETIAVETQRNLIFPAAPPAPTQPKQTQPLRPVESTNNLNPTQPPRDKASQQNKPVNLP